MIHVYSIIEWIEFVTCENMLWVHAIFSNNFLPFFIIFNKKKLLIFIRKQFFEKYWNVFKVRMIYSGFC